ncbi:MAG: porin family protein [Bacteroidota bacterium]
MSICRPALLVIGLLFCSSLISQDGFKLGLRGGLVGSQVAGDGLGGFDKLGFFLGPSVERELGNNNSLEIGLQYISKGSLKNINPDKGDFLSYKLNLSYVEMPILYKFHQERFIYALGLGPEFLITTKEIDNDGIELDSGDQFNSISVALYIGMDYSFGEKSFMSIRFTNSLTPLRNTIATGTNQLNFWRRIFNQGQYNTLIEFGYKRLIG